MHEMASLFAPPKVNIARRPDGTIMLSNPVIRTPHAQRVGEWLEHWAVAVPTRTFLQQRELSGQWQSVSYSDARDQVHAIATFLLSEDVGVHRPVMVLSENSIEHGLLALACMHIGVPVAAVSPAFSLMSKDFGKLKAVTRQLTPGLIFCSDAAMFSGALAALDGLHSAVVIAQRNASSPALAATAMYQATDSERVLGAFAKVTPGTVARILFTSGSTGEPKGVINPHLMLTSNQGARLQNWPFLTHTPPVVVDWLPWSHTFGANHNFNMVLANGGTMVIDTGKPAPVLFDETVRNLREIQPTVYFNVPRGYDMLIAQLKADSDLCKAFFSRLQLLFYAAAALPQSAWDALRNLSTRTTGRVVPMVSAWGSTETAPLAADCHFQAVRSGVIGLPIPGVELKIVPAGDKQEIRVRGPNVMPGYWRKPELTAQAFDEEGFYKIGDAVRLLDEDAPERGLLFDGRVAEDFKLSSGTWVNVGMLRINAIEALAPVAQDVVIAGHDSEAVKFLVFPNINACREICSASNQTPLTEVLADERVRAATAAGLQRLFESSQGASSAHGVAALLMEQPASIDAGEITDKGYLNQRAVLAARAPLLNLFAIAHPSVIHRAR
jgi:feruloyl-CoA synthase